MTTLLDTNILICLANPAERHHTWSVTELHGCKARGPAIISDIVYSELSAGMATQADVDAVVAHFGLQRFRGTDEALFRAGHAFKEYKRRGGTKTNVLPDFLIGAIADVLGAPLMTANPKDFKIYFPSLHLIRP
jgi:predicted nucleic acid-binding protein